MSPKPEDARILESRCLAEGKFIHLKQMDWRAADGSSHVWECVNRNRCGGAVVLICTLKPTRRLVLIKQFRPPANRVVLEFPAGLIDPGETPEAAAYRELYEETGYRGEIKAVYPTAYSSPGLTGENLHLIRMSIDETLAQNQNPQPHFDDSECIETFLVDAEKLSDFVLAQSSQGIGIDAKVMAFALTPAKA